jgi:MSHA pilin protein MshC
MQGRFQKAFSLVELVTVVVLLAILAVAAFSRMSGFGSFEQKAFFDDVVSAMRYAQKLAISTGCSVQVAITSGSYALKQGDTCTSSSYTRNVLHPAKRTAAYQNSSPPDGVSISPAATLVFTPQQQVTGLAGNTTFSIGSYSFTVHEKSGLVDVN